MFDSILSQEEQDIKALQAKNRKLGEALDQRQVNEFPNICLQLTLEAAFASPLVLRKLNPLACRFSGD